VSVFVDTAVIMYAGGAEHPLRRPSQAILQGVAEGRLPGVTSAEVIQEILHRFGALRRPELGSAMARHALDLFAPVLPITHLVMRRMSDLVDRYPALSARDLVHVATCLEERIFVIVSADAGFDRVTEIARVAPDDEAAVAAHQG
jgi:predicted nucleic acid-binding protein